MPRKILATRSIGPLNTTKYLNRKTASGYDSKKEERCALEFRSLMSAADPAERVTNVARQVRFELLPAQRDPETNRLIERAASYIADFVVDYADGAQRVFDCKNPVTKRLPAYVLKRKLMLFFHGIRIHEI